MPKTDYRILDPAGRRSDLTGCVLAVAHDLASLHGRAERLSRDGPPGTYPVAIATGPDWASRPWGELRVAGPDAWAIRTLDGSLTMAPGVIIA